jgi:hypothetical protein
LRCLVEDDENGQLVVGIDDQELSPMPYRNSGIDLAN